MGDAESPSVAPKPPTGQAGSRRRATLVLGAVLLATAAVYGPGLGHPFHFDSVLKIEDNPRLRDPAGYLEALGAGRYTERAGRLLTNLSYSADYHLHGLDPFGFHLTDLLLHMCVVVLVFAFGRALWSRLGDGSDTVPLLAAGLFALHPLNSEAVNYLNARANQLVALFYLAALLCMLHARDAETRRGRLGAWGGFVVAAVGALLSKELAITLVVMAPLCAWWTRRPDASPAPPRLAGRVPFLALAVAALGVAWAMGVHREIRRAVVRVGGHVSGHWALFLGVTVLGQSEIFLRYLGLALCPAPQLLNVDHRTVLHLHERLARAGSGAAAVLRELAVPVLCCLVLLAAVVWAFRHRRRAPLVSLLVLWPVVTHAPTSLVPRGEVMVEYRTYLPMVGVCLLLALGLQRLGARLGTVVTAPALRLGAGALLAVLAACTVVRNQDWKSQESLWRDSLAKAPDNFRAHHALAALLGAAGRTDEAVAHYHRALELFPPDPEANNNLGNMLLARGEIDEAMQLYRRAIGRRPSFAAAHANLGRAFAARGEFEEALPHYRRALELRPMLAETHNNLASALASLGRIAEAREHFDRAIELMPSMATAHANLAGLLLEQGDVARAEREYREALRLDPELALAHTGLGGLLAGQRRLDEAVASFRRALELEPESPAALNNLGSALAYRGELDAAIALFERALRLEPGYADAAVNLRRARELQAGRSPGRSP